MPKRVLVVDDDPINLKMSEFILKQKHYEIVKANSGMIGLEYLQNEKNPEINLVLLDIEMPVMNGFRTLEFIRANDKIKDIPVMFLTASADQEVVREAARLGAVGYIKKPFLPDDLLDRVGKILG